ncbi:hypothetical protein COX68_00425 [Candidatus Falkowbacteria bacterium CG_4_10_14_0_2_um_filter_41_15]|uniref:Uncharacterized protein n=1 Tax=Candidatus Falkowbacteria bacterium CG_4_10_14_0_2_um_filter_41_15 TaxID=1974554 RepID=A0A2M7W0A9_9BACT|nr:MAG: hypothetical protein COX68_00425 [Candidatus Falkowbacteria bacterium CG_4_10_14_0_2_um_filter_41_15]
MKFEGVSKKLGQKALNNIESNKPGKGAGDFLVEETELDPQTGEAKPIKGKIVNAKKELLEESLNVKNLN